MKLVLLEDGKNRISFEIQGEGHSFCNILKKELWEDESMEIAGYQIEHSLVGAPVFTVETAKGDAKKTVMETVERLRKQNKELLEAFKKV